MTRRLIVNGDDLGRNESLTRGVVMAYERGILTSTSIVAGSSHFDLGVSLARERPGLAAGVHLVVDEYPPVSNPTGIPSLVDGNGAFLPRSVTLRRILLGQVRPDEIRLEWGAQIRKVVEAGIEPTHLDGHGHCHASPTLAKTVVELAREFGICTVRLPAEPLSYRGGPGKFSMRRYVEKALLVGACLAFRSRWRGRLRHPDTFWGFMDGGRLSPAMLDGIARSLKPGLAELMTHPALDNDDPPYGLDYDWRGDLDTLLAYSKGEFEQRFGIDLMSWRDAWSSP